jgi:hypothetical protein
MLEEKAHHRTATAVQVAADLADTAQVVLKDTITDAVVKPVMAQARALAHTIFGIKDLC